MSLAKYVTVIKKINIIYKWILTELKDSFIFNKIKKVKIKKFLL